MERWREQPSRFTCVFERHPREAGLIRRLLISNTEFRELCEDYVLLSEMTAELASGMTEGHDKVLAEYIQLAGELDQDISRALAKLADTPL